MNQGGFTTRYEQLRFVKSNKRIFWSETKKEILWDLDGSLGGVADSMIVRSYPSVVWPDVCTVLPNTGYTDSVRCGGNGSDVRIRRMQLENVSPGQLYYTDLDVISDAGTGSFYFLPLDTSGWVFPVVTGTNRTYSLDWADSGHTTTRTMSLTSGRIAYLQETIGNPLINEDVIIRNDLRYSHTWDYDPYSFVVQYNYVTRWVPINHTNPMLTIGNARYENYTFDVLLTNKGASLTTSNPFGVSTAAKLCPPRGCPVPPVPNPGVPLLWSKKSSWSTNNYKVPTAGQAVTISADMWIVMDISPPNLGCITINGKLTFLSNASHPRTLTLAVQCIKLWGTMEILGEDNNTFVGQATVIVNGAKGASPPVTMGEGNFVGSKVISVAGRLAARGEIVTTTWTKLNSTVTAGSSTLILSEEVAWSVGDEIVISPTGYFNEAGTSWSMKGKIGNSVESRKVTAILTIASPTGNITQLTLNSHLNHTHLCETIHGEKFCGAVGLLTRSVKFISLDGDVPKTTSFGYGANIHVIDVFDSVPYRYGSVDLRNVEFNKFGKLNNDHYAISISHRDYNHPPSYVMGCAFKYGFNLATRISHANNVTFSNNIAVGNYGGGVYIEDTTTNFEVNHNLLLATYQLPSVLLSSYPWVRPISAFTILSPHGVCAGNLAAGSDDQGFSVATSMFKLDAVQSSQCYVTKMAPYSYSMATLETGRVFYDNEAVACRGGLSIVAVSPSESKDSDCVVVSGFTAWRNSHTGILSVDAQANILIAGVVLAENHIGVTLHFYKDDVNVFTGIVASKIIGSIGLNTGKCTDLPDSVWNRGRHCQAFTATDPLGFRTTCGSVISQLYRRVGVLIPQWTNKPKTCAIAGRFAGLACDPPTTPDRLCEMPWEKRYGLPLDVAYAEQHIHDTAFIGFQSYVFNETASSSCIPSDAVEYSPAIAINPSQIDMQPTLITSGLLWDQTNLASRLSFGVGTFTGAESGAPVTCADRPCSGQNMMIIHDADGSLANQGVSGQLVWNNPEYMAPYPFCYEIPEVYLGVYFCGHKADPNKEFIQYSALWRDWGPQVIQPIITTRHFVGERINRSFASYGPIDDMCAKRMYFSRFPMLIANGTTQSIMSTGTTPSEVLLRWDAPSIYHVAILKIFITQSYDINVLVSNNPYENFQVIPKFKDRYPNFADPAGSNTRDPPKRLVIVVLRGGDRIFYRFRQVPIVAVTMKLDLPFETFVGNTFVANMAMLLGISRSRIKIIDVRKGSTVVAFSTTPNTTIAANATDVSKQVADLHSVTATLNQVILSGSFESTIAPILTCAAVVSHSDLLNPYNAVKEYPRNATLNSSLLRAVAISAAIPTPIILASYPTSQPSQQPSRIPSHQPTEIPSQKPSRQPNSVPSSRPSFIPSMIPSLQPFSKPTMQPSLQPVEYPSVQPSNSPVRTPTSQPVHVPSEQPSHQPNRRPTSQPSMQPSSTPSKRPSSQPNYTPTRQPSDTPTSQPSNQPISKPSMQPSHRPTSQPSFLPTTLPSSEPSRQPSSMPSHPSSQPSSQPSDFPTHTPTKQPSKQPQSKPTKQPSKQPAMKPSRLPSKQPVSRPSRVPSSQPSRQPWRRPSVQPTKQPSFHPSRQPFCKPTLRPSSQPSNRPTIQPILKPSSQPSKVPTKQPHSKPTRVPSNQPFDGPTAKPSRQPSFQPLYHPSSRPSFQPAGHPTGIPSNRPSIIPSISPSQQPTMSPSSLPTHSPTTIPSHRPSIHPTTKPFVRPSTQPVSYPTSQPAHDPTTEPSAKPSISPTLQPFSRPSSQPFHTPTSLPSNNPTVRPSTQPSNQPFSWPSADPSHAPSTQPSSKPFLHPTNIPSFKPSVNPTMNPTSQPSSSPTTLPVADPTCQPSYKPSTHPSQQPLEHPSIRPTAQPYSHPSSQPHTYPSSQPNLHPSKQPSNQPTRKPSSSKVNALTLQSTLIIAKTNAAALSSSYAAQLSLTKAATVPIADVTPTVTVASITAYTTRRAARMLVATDSTQVVLNVEFKFIESNSTYAAVYNSYISRLNANVANGNFAKALNSTVFRNATVSSLQFSTFSVTSVNRLTSPSAAPSTRPTALPTIRPTATPTVLPTPSPTFNPSKKPTVLPSTIPTIRPTSSPTVRPTLNPTFVPTATPTVFPSKPPTIRPSNNPTTVPTVLPTRRPTTSPTFLSTLSPTIRPTLSPTTLPTSLLPSIRPTTIHPSANPTIISTTIRPTKPISVQPTTRPTARPTSSPTIVSTPSPTIRPSTTPTVSPTLSPTRIPTVTPSSLLPSVCPSIYQSVKPSIRPSTTPSLRPTTIRPTSIPTIQPSVNPTVLSTASPTLRSSKTPSVLPTKRPTARPSKSLPSPMPSKIRTAPPSTSPVVIPRRLCIFTTSCFYLGKYDACERGTFCSTAVQPQGQCLEIAVTKVGNCLLTNQGGCNSPSYACCNSAAICRDNLCVLGVNGCSHDGYYEVPIPKPVASPTQRTSCKPTKFTFSNSKPSIPTSNSTVVPSSAWPTTVASEFPTSIPASTHPTPRPSSIIPTAIASTTPTVRPSTIYPTIRPTTDSPTTTRSPTARPTTSSPTTISPTMGPITVNPTICPTTTTLNPTARLTSISPMPVPPTTISPTVRPTTTNPTTRPTPRPSYFPTI